MWIFLELLLFLLQDLPALLPEIALNKGEGRIHTFYCSLLMRVLSHKAVGIPQILAVCLLNYQPCSITWCVIPFHFPFSALWQVFGILYTCYWHCKNKVHIFEQILPWFLNPWKILEVLWVIIVITVLFLNNGIFIFSLSPLSLSLSRPVL